MSLYSWTSGQCLCKTFLQKGSISHCMTIFIPAISKPRSKPPIPEKKDATRKRFSIMLISIKLLLNIPKVLGIVKGCRLELKMILVQWRLKEFLERERITPYKLMKLTQGRVSKNTIGSAVRNDLNGVQFSTLAAIIEVLESNIGREISISELIEVRRNEVE